MAIVEFEANIKAKSNLHITKFGQTPEGLKKLKEILSPELYEQVESAIKINSKDTLSLNDIIGE